MIPLRNPSSAERLPIAGKTVYSAKSDPAELERSMKPKIYVGCGLTNAPPSYRIFVENFKARLVENFNVEVLKFVGLTGGTPRDVFLTDLGNVRKCDAMIAFVDEASTGLGWELGVATESKKQVLCLHRTGQNITRFVIGARDNDCVEMVSYGDLGDALESAGQFLVHVLGQSVVTKTSDENSAELEEMG